eukprot:snap_masked-scaffold43_size480169-processed-gene-0.1 protein:Tk12717 transcript:snap_masked-scaffold43_size480169-processed-gene-0.1-mRNA-1 annotation:"enhancer of split mgamma protein"
MSLDPSRISAATVTSRSAVALSSNMITPATPTFASMHTHFLQQHHQHRLAMANSAALMNAASGTSGASGPMGHNNSPVTPEHQRLVNQHHLLSSSGSSGSSSSGGDTPMSRTNQYKKIMKPLLERKRRARINKCLDELKDIMTVALQAQGENVSKLEKADILELTVRHLHKLQQSQRLLIETQRNPVEEIQRFQAGYSSCAQEAASFLLQAPGVDVTVSQRLLSHLTANLANPFLNRLNQASTPPKIATAPPPRSFSGSTPATGSESFRRCGFSSPPLSSRMCSASVSASTEFPKASPPPRPSSNPTATIGHFTLSITKAPLSEPARPGDVACQMPLKPEPIRLNPNDPPPSDSSEESASFFTMAEVLMLKGEMSEGDTAGEADWGRLMVVPKWLMMEVPKWMFTPGTEAR